MAHRGQDKEHQGLVSYHEDRILPCRNIRGINPWRKQRSKHHWNIFVRAGMVGTGTALLVGSGAIALGVLTYSRGVMTTVGKRITSMSDLAALTATLAMDITVHIFTWVGVPVSTSQAIVGSVVGVGLVKSTRSIDLKVIGKIGVGWVGTIVLSLVLTFVLLKIVTFIF